MKKIAESDYSPCRVSTHRPKDSDLPSPLHIAKKSRTKERSMGSQWEAGDRVSSDSFGPPLTVVKKRGNRRKSRSEENNPPSCQSSFACGHGLQLRHVTPERSMSRPQACTMLKERDNPEDQRQLSSSQFHQHFSPARFGGLRWFSKRRTSSTKTTRRHFGLQDGSEFSDASSIVSQGAPGERSLSVDQPSKPFHTQPPSFDLEVAMIHPTRVASGISAASFLECNHGVLNTYMLVPRILITPEFSELDDGTSNMWAAIEIAGQLSCPLSLHAVKDAATAGLDQPCFTPVCHGGADLSRCGCLYDINVDVVSTKHSSIIDVIDAQVSQTLSPGSSLLLLAHIRLEAIKPAPTYVYGQEESDSLIADLQYQLGGIKTDYLRVSMTYAHSGFPKVKDISVEDGISNLYTRLETATTGVIHRHDGRSTWSPRPACTPNPLLGIMTSHWGPARANEVFHRVIMQRKVWRRTLNGDQKSGFESAKMQVDTTKQSILPIENRKISIPRRRTSLNQTTIDTEVDLARKIWTEMRRTSSGQRPAFHVGKVNRSPAATTYAVSHKASSTDLSLSSDATSNSNSEIERKRKRIRDAALRNRRSIGAESLKSLVPSMVGLSLNLDGKLDEKQPPLPLRTPTPGGRPDRRRQQGRWSLGGWW